MRGRVPVRRGPVRPDGGGRHGSGQRHRARQGDRPRGSHGHDRLGQVRGDRRRGRAPVVCIVLVRRPLGGVEAAVGAGEDVAGEDGAA
ncbi:hypothetical protein, partial [Microbispora rosea]